MLSYLQIKKKKEKEERVMKRLQRKEEKRPLLNPSTFSSGVTQNPHKSTLRKTKRTGLPFPQVSKVVFRKLN